MADVIVPTVTDRLDARILSRAGEKLRLIANFGAGVDNIDLESARARGITGADPNDIDLMVVGSPEASAVFEACRRVEPEVRRPINATILSAEEFAQDSGFLRSVRENPILPIVGGEG
jgi:lactate dehydrogenase-like 2-hydroxyacid dehydrogenase